MAMAWQMAIWIFMSRQGRLAFSGNSSSGLSSFAATGNVAGRTCRSEEHTSELQSQSNLVCRLLLEKKKKNTYTHSSKPHVVNEIDRRADDNRTACTSSHTHHK